MKKTLSLLLVAICSLQWAACSTHRAYVKYDDFKEDMKISEGEVSGGEFIGKVSGEDGGAVWDNCSEKAAGSVRDLIANAKGMGANAIGNVTWHASGNAEPMCKKGWGYVMLWPFLLTPLFMSTAVSASAYKVAAPAKAAGVYMLPATPEAEEALIQSLIRSQAE